MSQLRRLARRPKGSKYGNRKTMVEGITFDSQREARRYQELRLLEKAGEIVSLQRQVPYDLQTINQMSQRKRIGCYIADFSYIDVRRHLRVVEDVKGYRTDLYRWKKKHVEAQYDIRILET